METELKEILSTIGFKRNEMESYIDLMRNGKSSALEISKRTKIHRSNIYDALRELIEKGFVFEIIEEKRKLFKVGPPERIKDFLKQQEQEIDSLMPVLQRESNKKENENEVSIVQGVFAVREALMDLLNEKKPIECYGATQKAFETLGLALVREFHTERIKNKIPMKQIYDSESKQRINKLRKMKFIDVKTVNHRYYSLVSTNICGDIVLLLVFDSSVSAIIIKNKEIAKSYRKSFELMWKYAK